MNIKEIYLLQSDGTNSFHVHKTNGLFLIFVVISSP